MRNKSILWLMAVLILLAAGLYGYSYFTTKEFTGNSGTTQHGKVTTTLVPEDRLPKNFPSSIPLEAGAAVTVNQNSVDLNGNQVASREFVSSKTIWENFTFYKEVLEKEGWTITSTSDKETQKVIFATKGKQEVNIRCYGSSDARTSRVAINVVSK